MRFKVFLAVSALSLTACKKDGGAAATDQSGAGAKPADAKPVSYDQIPRDAFLRLAAAHALPIFWTADNNGNDTIDADELVEIWGVPGKRGQWVADGKLTPQFDEAYRTLLAEHRSGPDLSKLDEAEKTRRKAVLKELAQGRPTLVTSDFSGASDGDKKIVRLVLEAAELIEQIFARQQGTAGMENRIPADDAASRMLFYRNQGPWCEAPATENDDNCSAVSPRPKRISGLYPEKIQSDDKFCDTLAKHPKADELMHQFHVVRTQGDELIAVPYTAAFDKKMKAIAAKLEEAAKHVGEGEEAFAAYLNAAAKAFTTNDWEPADEAWSKMSVHNSKWYLRIGPDEVYFEPCRRKAGFHVSFARINQDSLEWQNKLDPVKTDMEKAIAKLAGKPYKARDVAFHMPDFIDIIVNAGDSRSAHGATIGQSLPNWGPVANEGRGRTVAMTNLYADKDSMDALETQAKSLLCNDTMTHFIRDPSVQVMSTVLHEAAHNLGPAHEYKVGGKTAPKIFGGPMASMLEELKSQTAALYYTDWLAERGIITAERAKQAHVRDMIWAFGHISRGMYGSDGRPKPYSQLAAVQFGHLVKSGAITYRPDERAANGTDGGCFAFDLDKFPPAILALMTRVARIKGSGDKKDAEKIVAEFVDVEGEQKQALAIITDRWLRAPKASFVYAVKE
ncbi:MAG: hypothetical protein RIT81_07655 [Deltaproteobacteria bacterium]